MKYLVLLATICFQQALLAQNSQTIIDWGDNTNRQLFPAFEERKPEHVSIGFINSAYIENGKITIIGNNEHGQTDVSSETLLKITSGFEHTIGLTSDSSLVGWGNNVHGQLNFPNHTLPFVDIESGDAHVIALDIEGHMLVWGDSTFGQDTIPEAVENTKVLSISAGNGHNLVIDSAGMVHAWGRNDFGQCNVPDINDSVIAVAGGKLHSVALTQSGRIFAWGDNKFFQQLDIPSSAQGNTIQIEAGDHHTLALLRDSTIVSWGNNTFKQQELPLLLSGRVVHDIQAGYSGSAVIASNHTPDEIINDTLYLFEEADYRQRLTLAVRDRDLVDYLCSGITSGEGDDDNAFFNSSFSLTKVLNPDFSLWSDDRIFTEFGDAGLYASTLYYEPFQPLDYEEKNLFKIRLRSVDVGGAYVDKPMFISVINVNEKPTSINISNLSVDEGLPAGTIVGELSANDPDGDSITFLFGPSGPSNGNFSINNNQLLTNKKLNFNEQQKMVVSLRARDQGNLFTDSLFTITINNVNGAPTKIELSANEVYDNAEIGLKIGEFNVSDPDQEDNHTLAFYDTTANTFAEYFDILGKNLIVKNNLSEAGVENLILYVKATDNGNPSLTYFEGVEIKILASNKKPTGIELASSFFSSELTSGDLVTTMTTIDEDDQDTHFYELIEGENSDDNNYFSIITDQLIINSTLDKDTFNIRIKSTDDGSPQNLSIENSFRIIAQLPVDQLFPTDITLTNNTITENQPAQTIIGSFDAIDETVDDTHIFVLVPNDDSPFFSIEKDKLIANTSFNFENRSTYQLDVKTQDLSGNAFSKRFEIIVNDTTETADQLTLSNNSINEGTPIGSAIATISFNGDKPNEDYAVTITDRSGNLSNRYEVRNSTLMNLTTPDYEASREDELFLKVSFNGQPLFNDTLAISIIDINDPITGVEISNTDISEGFVSGNVIALFRAIDQDQFEQHTYSLINGDGDDDNESFTIQRNQLVLNTELDFEEKSNYSIRIKVTDQADVSVEEVFTLTITPVTLDNIPPQSVSLTNFQKNENNFDDRFIGVLNAVDPNEEDHIIFSLNGGIDDAFFEIFNDSLFTKVVFDFETKPTYSINVLATDGQGGSLNQTLPISVLDINESPLRISLSNTIFSQEQGQNVRIGQLITEDEDLAQKHQYTLLATEDNSNFRILNGNEIWSSVSLDTRSDRDFQVSIRSTDDGFPSLSIDTTLTISFRKPPKIKSTVFTISESQGLGSEVGKLLVESVGEYTVSITDGNEEGIFAYNDNAKELFVTRDDAFNITSNPSYSLTLVVTTANGLSTTGVVLIKVKQGNRPELLDGTFRANEDITTGTVIGTIPFIAPEPDSISFNVTTDSEMSEFSIDQQGQLILSKGVLNYEERSIYTIDVVANSNDGFTDNKRYFISILNNNDAPGNTSLSDSIIKANQRIGTRIGLLTTEDEDPGDDHQYEVIDNSNFSIVDNYLVTAQPIESSDTTIQTVKIRVTDNGTPAKSTEVSFSIRIDPVPDIRIFNVVTPNNDGFNDVWKIENINFYRDIVIRVLNSSGTTVFESVGYATPWDGRYKGSPLSTGPYYYRVSVDNQLFQGTLTILND